MSGGGSMQVRIGVQYVPKELVARCDRRRLVRRVRGGERGTKSERKEQPEDAVCHGHSVRAGRAARQECRMTNGEGCGYNGGTHDGDSTSIEYGRCAGRNG